MAGKYSYIDYLRLSTDLMRISNWLRADDDRLIEDFLKIILKKFGADGFEIGGKAISIWLADITNYRENRSRSAEESMALSGLLNDEFIEVYFKNKFGEMG